jgi:hypothetical protein
MTDDGAVCERRTRIGKPARDGDRIGPSFRKVVVRGDAEDAIASGNDKQLVGICNQNWVCIDWHLRPGQLHKPVLRVRLPPNID